MLDKKLSVCTPKISFYFRGIPLLFLLLKGLRYKGYDQEFWEFLKKLITLFFRVDRSSSGPLLPSVPSSIMFQRNVIRKSLCITENIMIIKKYPLQL